MPASERLDSPAFGQVRGDLARLYIERKAEIGLAGRADADIVERVDDITFQLLQTIGRATLAGNAAFLARYSWLVDAFDRLETDRPAVTLDG